MSFGLSFDLALLGPTGAHWMDDPSNVSCKDRTRQYAVDDPLLFCNSRSAWRFGFDSGRGWWLGCTVAGLDLERSDGG